VKKIKSALISAYSKDGLDVIVKELDRLGVHLYSTGGTGDFIKKMGIGVTLVENITGYPSILGGRVKTLHPKVFGGILSRDNNESDVNDLARFEIPEYDLVLVDLYPFEVTVVQGGSHSEIIEKIDIGGISLIRAAAKNYNRVLVVSSSSCYDDLLKILKEQDGETTVEQREWFAAQAFNVSSHYDTAIFSYMNRNAKIPVFKQSVTANLPLRYGENPHQQASFYGDIDSLFEKLNGKDISYNNLLDIDAALSLIQEFSEPTFAILKHNNACGCASRASLLDAWKDALIADPVSAYGGILVANRPIDKACAEEINKLFFEVILAPGYGVDALELLKSKKNRIILKVKELKLPAVQFRSLLNGVAVQDRDAKLGGAGGFDTVTDKKPTEEEVTDLLFANRLVKHSKSNTIVLAKGGMLLAGGVGQTSRVDALKQAIAKAKSFNLSLEGAVMASDAFFPFADCVEIAREAGVNAVVEPGGSVRDQDSIDYCNKNNMTMIFTGIRHFKH
jgi:phosphoribosylaminoimidazolecarboxamide formyltransferase/IMP cyclohydrolase